MEMMEVMELSVDSHFHHINHLLPPVGGKEWHGHIHRI